jgi:CheY-like chemotaxis protein
VDRAIAEADARGSARALLIAAAVRVPQVFSRNPQVGSSRTGYQSARSHPQQARTVTPDSPVIAIIDDDLDVRGAMAALAVSHGYAIELYASGERFLAHAAQSAAACLILDVQLGGMSGIALARQLCDLGLSFPIVFVTGSGDETLRTQAAQLNFVAYLQKPVSANLLMAAIALALDP